MWKCSHGRLATVIAIAGSLLMLTALPSVAAAKKSKSASLTKAEVIKLIEQYSKPGPQGQQGQQGQQGPKGDTGPAGSYTLASGSGLQLSGNALSVNTGSCPGFGFSYGFSNGTLGCRPEPTSDYQTKFAGYGSGTLFGEFPPVGLTITNTYSEVASVTVGVTGAHIVNAAIQLASSAVDTDRCQLRQNSTELQTEEVVIPVNAGGSGFATMYLQDGVQATAGDTFSVWCNTGNTGQSDNAGGNLVAYLANN